MAEAQLHYGTGKRKGAIAKVWLRPGTGEIVINNLSVAEYLHRYALTHIVLEAFEVTGTTGEYDVKAIVLGGGKSGQAYAIRHGIAKALVEDKEEFRGPLREKGLLTRDPRVKERKHAGFRKARRRKQFSKR